MGQAVALVLLLDITNTPNNGETLTPVFQIKDSISGKYVSTVAFGGILASAIGANPTTATFAYMIDPRLGATSAVSPTGTGGFGYASFGPGGTMRCYFQPSGASPWTYSVSVQKLS